MKKVILNLIIVVAFAFGSMLTSGCGGNEASHEQTESHEHAEAVYQCPMKCEEDKTYDEAGSCPVCGMDLKEVGHGH